MFLIKVMHGTETQIHYGMGLFYILMGFGEFALDYTSSEYIKEVKGRGGKFRKSYLSINGNW